MAAKLTGRPWRRAAARVRAQQGPCHLCGKPIDYSLDYRDPQAFTVDHLDARSTGGSVLDPANLKPAHRSCNSARGAKTVEAVRPLPTSRQW